jgi:glycine betaine/proline transport system substrate-binding protein
MKKLVKYAVSGAFALTMSVSVNAADVVIGVPNWSSVMAMGNILKVVLEDNLGLEVELQSGTNPIVFEAMDKGTMDVHPEVWLPNQANLHQTYVVDKATVVKNPNAVISFQGMCASTDTSKKYGITSMSDLTNPEIAKLLDTDGDGKGELWIGATGWASTNVERIRAKSYGYDQTLELLEMDETLALAKTDAAIKQGKPYVGLCWTPHHMFALYDLTVLKEPAHDPEQWNVLQPTDDPDWLSKSSAPVAWSETFLHIHYAKSLESRQPQAAQILASVKLTTEDVNAMVYAIVVEKVDAEAYAKQWVEDNSELVDSWL